MRVALPDKKYFKIGEVADLVGVEPHVLRYWETQFPQVRPHKARSGHRLYRRKDVETLLSIRELLHVQRFTIAGARQALRAQHGAKDGHTTTPPGMVDETLEEALQALDAEAPIDDDTTTLPRMIEIDVEALSAEGLAVALSRQAVEQQGADAVEVEVEVAPAPPAAAAPPRRRERGAQLGFGFQASGRALLESARADLRALVAVLDREDARDRRFFQAAGQALGAHST